MRYNRYSYIQNNPLGGVNPSGYTAIRWNQAHRSAERKQFIQSAARFVFQTSLRFGAMSAGNPLVVAAAEAFIAGMNGGSAREVRQAALRGAVTAGVFWGVGELGKSGCVKTYKPLVHAGTQASIGKAFGDSDRQLILTAFSADVGDAKGSPASKVLIAGTISKLGGGDFIQGALTVAFVHLYNQAKHEEAEAEEKAKRLKLERQLTRRVKVALNAAGDLRVNIQASDKIKLKYNSETGQFAGEVSVGAVKYTLSFSVEGFEQISGKFSKATISIGSVTELGFAAKLKIDPYTIGGIDVLPRMSVSVGYDFKRTRAYQNALKARCGQICKMEENGL